MTISAAADSAARSTAPYADRFNDRRAAVATLIPRSAQARCHALALAARPAAAPALSQLVGPGLGDLCPYSAVNLRLCHT